ncbi:MAG: winged helix-turn-helix domain-containing protein [Flavisolibacter sp.]|nr:winged helix-turn-helix domain-containing protein [Flavisolibacter sp.]
MKRDQRCLDYRKAIKEGEQELLSLERRQNYSILRDRMRFLRLLKSGECPSQAKAGGQIGLGLRGSEKLWKKYRREGIEGLLTYPYEGTKGKLTEKQEQQLFKELQRDDTSTLQQACDYVEQKFGVSYTVPGMDYVFKPLKVKKKTGRPVYTNKDYKAEKHFKKKIPSTKAAVRKALLPAR